MSGDGSVQREVLATFGGAVRGADFEFRVERWTIMMDGPIGALKRAVLMWDEVEGDEEFAVVLSPERAKQVARLLTQ